MAITISVNKWRISRSLVDEGSALSLLYQNCWSKIDLPDKFTLKDVGKVTDFNGSTTKPYGQAMLNIKLQGKVASIDFYPGNYKAPHNGLLRSH